MKTFTQVVVVEVDTDAFARNTRSFHALIGRAVETAVDLDVEVDVEVDMEIWRG